MEYHRIETRSPRRGGSYYGYDSDYDDNYYWPIYLYIIVSLLVLMASLFFWSLVFYSVRGERQRETAAQWPNQSGWAYR